MDSFSDYLSIVIDVQLASDVKWCILLSELCHLLPIYLVW